MVVRIDNLTKWEKLPKGKALSLPGETARAIRLELNCPAPARIDVAQGDQVAFVAVVTGRDTVRFSVAEGHADIVFTSEDDVWFYTKDGDVTSEERPEAVSFTRIMERQTRNPQLELMMFKANQNELRRQANADAQRAELAAFMAEMKAQKEALNANNTGTTGDTSGSEQTAAPGTAAPDAGASGAAANAGT